jgi:hypothetical protein
MMKTGVAKRNEVLMNDFSMVLTCSKNLCLNNKDQ